MSVNMEEVESVLRNERRWAVTAADCIDFANALPANSVALTCGSPPLHGRQDLRHRC